MLATYYSGYLATAKKDKSSTSSFIKTRAFILPKSNLSQIGLHPGDPVDDYVRVQADAAPDRTMQKHLGTPEAGQ